MAKTLLGNQTLQEWISDQLDILRLDWKSNWDTFEEKNDIADYFLRPALDNLGSPYTYDSDSREYVISVTPEISIVGKITWDKKCDFRAKIKNILIEKEVEICHTYVSVVSLYIPFLKQVIGNLQDLYNEMTDQTKSNKRSELLATIIRNSIESRVAKDEYDAIKVIPKLGNDSLCEIKFELLDQSISQSLCYTINADLKNYEGRIDDLLKAVSAVLSNKEILNLFKRLNIRETKIRGERSKAVDHCLITSYDKVTKVQYNSPKILRMTNTATKADVGNATVYNALEECGYKYYVNKKVDLHILMTDNIEIVKRSNLCILSRNGSDTDKGFYINDNEFARFLRIIAKLPSPAFNNLIDDTSFKSIATQGFSRVMRDYFVPPFCSTAIYDNVHSLIFTNPFRDNEDESRIEIQIPVNKRLISTWWVVIKNAQILHKLFYVSRECRLKSEENYDV